MIWVDFTDCEMSKMSKLSKMSTNVHTVQIITSYDLIALTIDTAKSAYLRV